MSEVPVDFAMEAVTPEDAVIGHIHVQGHGVLQRGHHLAVVSLHQVDAANLVAVGEEDVRAFPCGQSQNEKKKSLVMAGTVTK